MVPLFFEHPSSLEHDTGGHPESAARITAITRELSDRHWLGFERVQSPPVDRAVLEAVHPRSYIAAIEEVSVGGGGFLDLDTVVSPGSFEAALHAAGGAVQMVERLLARDAAVAFSAHRPPGHHALPAQAMGFCLFNNVAVAARYALEALGLQRVMIFDWDVHHGNGTNDTFHADQQLLFASIHQWPLYPGTGPPMDVGSGEGTGFTVNLPVPPGTGDAEYLSLVEHVVVPLARAFEPQLLLVSAGYDAHRDDSLADCRVTAEGFAAMTWSLRRICASLEIPLGMVLEGGYALSALATSIAATMEVMAAPPDGDMAVDGPDVAPIALQARERLAGWWPALASEP